MSRRHQPRASTLEPETHALGWALLVVGLLLAAISLAQQVRQRQAELQTQVDVVARLSAAALVFDHAGDGHENLQALGLVPAVVRAELRRAEGTLLVGVDGPAHEPGTRAWTDHSLWRIDAQIRAGGLVVGSLHVAASPIPMWAAVGRFVLVVWVVLALAWLATHLALGRMRADMRRAQARVLHMAHHDALTGLANRATLGMALAEAVLGGRECAVLLIDADDFKQVNDTQGHAAGDQVLRTLATRLQQHVGGHGVVARQGGDEFAVLLMLRAGRLDVAESLAAELIGHLPQPIDWEGSSLQVGVSIGYALLPADATTPEDAMQRADAALYQAKRLGKNTYARYAPALDAEQRGRKALMVELKTALDRRELQLHYQPIYDQDGHICSIEALARWQHATRGWIPPSAFVPPAEDSGLVVELGLAMLECLRRDLDHWAAMGLDVPPVAVNLASHQFRREADQARFLAHLHALRLGPHEIEFELTERAVFEDLASGPSVLRALQQQGYRVALDDFGTGYSSLAYLRRIKCDKIKIDRLFIVGVSRNAEARTLVQALIGVAHAMNLQVVAEGIETRRDQMTLRSMGCDLYQGYGLSRPLDTDSLAELLCEHDSRLGTRMAPESTFGPAPTDLKVAQGG